MIGIFHKHRLMRIFTIETNFFMLYPMVLSKKKLRLLLFLLVCLVLSLGLLTIISPLQWIDLERKVFLKISYSSSKWLSD